MLESKYFSNASSPSRHQNKSTNSLFSRLHDEAKKKMSTRVIAHNMKQKIELEGLFKPKINEKSRSLSKKRKQFEQYVTVSAALFDGSRLIEI